MIPIKLSYIAKQLGYRLIGDDQLICNIVTDSRKVDKGDCFIALYGESFDAHQFIEQVVTQGANAVIVSKSQDGHISQLLVDDTRQALADIAALVASLSKAKKIAITGSCGKTTVKEMISAILSRRGQVLATAGNFNNDIGVPLTLLRMTESDDFAVIELGANHQGEIDFTSALVKPDVALITNIGAAHLEGFGGIDGVVSAKSEIFNHLASTGTAIFDFGSEYAARWHIANQQQKICGFSIAGKSSNQTKFSTPCLYASDIVVDEHSMVSFTLHSPQGDVSINLALPGLHNIENAMAAAAATLAVGASLQDIAQGLHIMQGVGGRLNVITVNEKLTVIDDSYNANVTSITAACQMLGQSQNSRILVLGDMGELGEYALSSHQSLGPVIESNQIDLLMTCGELSHHYAAGFNGEHVHFTDKESLHQAVEQQLIKFMAQGNVTLLVKGSRSSKMESVVKFVKNNKNIKEVAQC
ncbi:MAG: UDP-N-acetylmuramoyl-tripeptide--D-alanyl-D-alanine ligase [Psychrobium sp.]|nr:UDP-N-acetylmuramoyl-tripeptide--D-alanyl-D-alanine ligase [Psychrobium sp.]